MATPAESATVVVPAPDGLQGTVAAVVMSAALPPAQRFAASRRLLPNRVRRIASRHKCPRAAARGAVREWRRLWFWSLAVVVAVYSTQRAFAERPPAAGARLNGSRANTRRTIGSKNSTGSDS